MFGILGSGYGLYGYLPPIAKRYGQVCLLEKAKDTCKNRAETLPFINKIVWANTQDDLCYKVNSLVIAQPPNIQHEIITKLKLSNRLQQFKNIFLEKPLASNPESATEILSAVIDSNSKLRVGYIPYYTQWFQDLKNQINQATKLGIKLNINLSWNFLAYYLANQQENWKRYHSQGGGCLRFYGIQIIALLADLDFMIINSSNLHFMSADIPVKWTADLSHNNGSNITIQIDVNSEPNEFCLIAKGLTDINFEFKDNGLFSTIDSKYKDNRSNYIDILLNSLNNPNDFYYSWYAKTNALWSAIEKQTVHETIK